MPCLVGVGGGGGVPHWCRDICYEKKKSNGNDKSEARSPKVPFLRGKKLKGLYSFQSEEKGGGMLLKREEEEKRRENCMVEVPFLGGGGGGGVIGLKVL